MERLRIEPATLRVSDWVFSEPPTITITRCASTHTPCAFSLSLSLSSSSLSPSLSPSSVSPSLPLEFAGAGWVGKENFTTVARARLSSFCPGAVSRVALCLRRTKNSNGSPPSPLSVCLALASSLNKHRSLEMKRLRNLISVSRAMARRPRGELANSGDGKWKDSGSNQPLCE